jgi:hypothetical protein
MISIRLKKWLNDNNIIRANKEKKLELELIRVKYELNKELTKIDIKRPDELEICKNELLFMKID